MASLKMNLKSPLIPLCLVVLIDHIGLGIIFPILVPIFMHDNGILGPDATDSLKSLWYNLTLSVFPITLFFGSTVLGSLSDRFGRKKVLSVCLLGAMGSYLLSAIALDFKCVSLLIISRALAGFTAGSMPIAQAGVIDISPEKDRAVNLGMVILAASLGFLLGPLIGGVFSNPNLIHWFSYSTPLYMAALLAFINFCMLKFFTETFVPSKPAPFKISKIFDLIVTPFTLKSIRFLAIIYLFLQLGWSAYFQFVSVFLLKRYQYTSVEIGLFMSLMGCGFAVGSSWMIRFLVKYFQDATIALIAVGLITLNILLTLLELHSILNWISSFVLGVFMATAYSIMIKLFSDTVSEQEQGWIMGVSEAIFAVAFALTPLLSVFLEQVALSVPLITATGLLAVSTLLLGGYWKSSTPNRNVISLSETV